MSKLPYEWVAKLVVPLLCPSLKFLMTLYSLLCYRWSKQAGQSCAEANRSFAVLWLVLVLALFVLELLRLVVMVLALLVLELVVLVEVVDQVDVVVELPESPHPL